MEAQTETKFAIKWILNVLPLKKAANHKRARCTLSLAVCTRSQHVCFLAFYDPARQTSLQPLKDSVTVNAKGFCSQREECMNFDCCVNDLNVRKFKKFGINSMRGLIKLREKAERERERMNDNKAKKE
jgi:hypothetical protein